MKRILFIGVALPPHSTLCGNMACQAVISPDTRVWVDEVVEWPVYCSRACGERAHPFDPPESPTPHDEDLPVLSPNVRNTDPETSRAAGDAIIANLSKIQQLVLESYRKRTRFSARQAERFPEFGDYGFSTIRKRISELAASGHLIAVGTETVSGRGPATVYEVAP